MRQNHLARGIEIIAFTFTFYKPSKARVDYQGGYGKKYGWRGFYSR
jgi:hypothetical protein